MDGYLHSPGTSQRSLLILTLASILQISTSALQDGGSVPAVHLPYHFNSFSHSKVKFDNVLHGKHTTLNIELLKSHTSSLKVTWALSNNTFADSQWEVTYQCEKSLGQNDSNHGKIVSNHLTTNHKTFDFHHLDPDTEYIVCVTILETSKARSNNMSIVHFNCRYFSTIKKIKKIPFLSKDSVVGVILTVGYMLTMGGIGYSVWWKKTFDIKKIRNERRLNIEANDEEYAEEEDEGENKIVGEHIKLTGSSQMQSSMSLKQENIGEKNSASVTFDNNKELRSRADGTASQY